LIKDNLISMIKDKLLSQLNEDDFYAILVNIQYVVNGSLKGTSPINSIIITGNPLPHQMALLKRAHFLKAQV
jgi:hypothetical protein